MNLAVLAEQAAERLGERMTLIFEKQRCTNFETLESARRIQTGLAGLGLAKGNIAALCMTNHPLVYSVFQGIFRTGAAAVPVMFQLTAPELRFIFSDTKSHIVITDSELLPKVREAVEGLDHIKHIVVRGGQDNPSSTPTELSLEDILAGDPSAELPQIDDSDTALLLYTSGTTGKPKGVMLMHSNLIASATASTDAGELDSWEGPRITVSSMPMAHIFGVGVMNGGYLVPKNLADGYMVQMKWFEPELFMSLIQEHKCTVIPSVPTMLALILNHPKVDEYDLSSLVDVACGAAPLPPELAQAFMKKYDCRVREIYGMTENTGIGSANRRTEPYTPGSAGRPYCNTEVKIFDEDDKEVTPGEAGEIVTRGPTTMKGYLNRPDATAEAVVDGWLHTGDIGYLDDEGRLFVVDRKKDMILRGGENIYPAELEAVIYTHPSVAEAAVVGAPDPVYGEKIVAYVVRRGEAELTGEQLLAHMRETVNKFKLPANIEFIDALPKSGVGKILRRELRDKAKQL